MDQTKPSRSAKRRTIFLSAMLGIGESASKCRLRNITEYGAMVEFGSLVPIGSTIIIVRGELSAAGEVKWSHGTQFGIRFSERIDVDKWLSEPFVAESSTHNPTKSRNLPVSTRAEKNKELLDVETIEIRLAEELEYVSRLVDAVGLVLVSDPLLKIRHSTSLQQLDLSQQMLSEIARIVTSKDKAAEISQIATGPMRGRLLRDKPI